MNNNKKDQYFKTLSVSKPKHCFYILGIIISCIVLIVLFILLFVLFDNQSIRPVFISCLISVLGGVLASFTIAYLIELSSCRRENNMVREQINNEIENLICYINLLFEDANNYYDTKKEYLDDLINDFPFESFDPSDEKSISVLVWLSLIISSLDTIKSINAQHGSAIFESLVKESLLSAEQGFIKFRECCFYKNNVLSKSIFTLISELSCDLYFLTHVDCFKKISKSYDKKPEDEKDQ